MELIVSLKERGGGENEVLFELQKILDTVECKLCNFVAGKSFAKGGRNPILKGGRNPILRHYCQEHFRGPLTAQAEKEIKENYCKRCKRTFSFNSTADRLAHVGYTHTALHLYLKPDSKDVDLTPFAVKELVVKEEQTFPCEECGKVFILKANLKAHMVYHNDERPFPCNLCAKAFKTLRDSDVHKSTHNGEKPYKCNICEKTVSQNGNLWTHKKVYHTDGSFTCKQCKENFPTKWDLTTHKQKHVKIM